MYTECGVTGNHHYDYNEFQGLLLNQLYLHAIFN